MCTHNRMHKIGRVLLLGTAGLVAAGLFASTLHAQSFEVSQNGKKVGTASLSLKQAAGGFDSTSGAKIDMPGLKYSFSENAALDGGYRLKTVELKGEVNGTSAVVNALQQGQQFVIKIKANGQATGTNLAFHPQAVFFPDFDPGALQTLLNVGAAHNNRDMWAIIPKQTGSIAALRIVTNRDEQGTLNGQQIAVHHLTVNLDTDKTEIFSSPSNELLQAEWSAEGFALVRQGFVLKPPARPTAPPPAAPPATTQAPAQQQPNPQQ
jgi:hypothetical protein